MTHKLISLFAVLLIVVLFAPARASEVPILSASNLQLLSKAIKENGSFLAKHSVQFQNLPISDDKSAKYALYFYSGEPKGKYLSSTFLQYFEDQSYHYVFEEFSGRKCTNKVVVEKMSEKEANEIIEKRYFSGANKEKKLKLLALINSIKLD